MKEPRHSDQVETDTADLDGTIARSDHEIELLREYRFRLIADIVTGKLDVREAAAHMPAEAEKPFEAGEDFAEGSEGGEAAESLDVFEEAEA